MEAKIKWSGAFGMAMFSAFGMWGVSLAYVEIRSGRLMSDATSFEAFVLIIIGTFFSAMWAAVCAVEALRDLRVLKRGPESRANPQGEIVL